MSVRKIAEDFGLHPAALTRHKTRHLGKRLFKAVERRDQNATDRLLNDVEHLWVESQAYLQDAKQARKAIQLTTTDPQGKPITTYEQVRDVGAMAPALAQALANRRLFGDATGVLQQLPASAAGSSTTNVLVVMPRPTLPEPARLDAIETTATTVTESD